MARKSPEPVYVWPEHEGDPTLGGAIPAELYDELQSSGSSTSSTSSTDDDG